MQKLLLVQSTIIWNLYLKILEGATFSNVHLNFASVTMTKAYTTVIFVYFWRQPHFFKVIFTSIIIIHTGKKKKETRTAIDSDQLLVTNIFEIGIFLMNRKQPENRKLLSSLVSSDWKTFKWFRLTYAWPSSCSRLGLWCQLSSSWSGVLNWQD